MWIAIFVLLAALFITNAIWIYVFQSYDFMSRRTAMDRIILTTKLEAMYTVGQKVRVKRNGK